MKASIWNIVFLVICATVPGLAQQGEAQLAYIEQYKDIAIREMERAGVPASIKLAQGILESDAGRSVLARRANNHFGIKCGNNWQGETFQKEDDDYDQNGQLIKSCFRVYKNGQASFVAHSEFLRDPQKTFRYGFLFRLDPKDYKGWAQGLRQAGYATSPTYPENLISLIERYELYRFDTMSAIDVETPTEILASGILSNNDVRYIVVGTGETLEDVARKVDVSVRNLIAYNDNLGAASAVQPGDRLYLQPKRNNYRGRQTYHTTLAGETMFRISQQYGVKLTKLLKRNRMTTGQEPATHEKVKLRGWKVNARPTLATEQPALPTIPTTVPVLPNGELDMEDPVPTPTPAPRPTPQPSAPVQPETGTTRPTNSGSGIIVPQNSTPAAAGNPTTPAPTRPTATTPPNTDAGNAATYHTVAAGETLFAISRRYNITVDALRTLNGLTSDTLAIGMKLRVK